jgi:hypothetical protein
LDSEPCGDVWDVELQVEEYLQGAGPSSFAAKFLVVGDKLVSGNCEDPLEIGKAVMAFLARVDGVFWAATLDDYSFVLPTMRDNVASAITARNLSLEIDAELAEGHKDSTVRIGHTFSNSGTEVVSFCIGSGSLWSILDSTDRHVRGIGRYRSSVKDPRCERRLRVAPDQPTRWVHKVKLSDDMNIEEIRVYAHLQLLTNRRNLREFSYLGSPAATIEDSRTEER